VVLIAPQDNEDLPVEQQQLMGNTVDGAAIEDGPETRPEQQQPVSVNEAVVGVNAVAAVESAAALSSSPDGVPGADAEEPSPNAVVSGGVASMESACATGAEVANDDSTAVAMSAQAVSADGPTASSLEHEVCLCVGDTSRPESLDSCAHRCATREYRRWEYLARRNAWEDIHVLALCFDAFESSTDTVGTMWIIL